RFGEARALAAEAAGEDQPVGQAALVEVDAVHDALLEHRRGPGVVGGRPEHDDRVRWRRLVALAGPDDVPGHAGQPQRQHQTDPEHRPCQPPGPAPAPPAAHAPSPAIRSTSGATLPPLRITPTRLPANASRLCSTAANAIAEDGSTSCLSRCHSSRIAARVSASSTVSTRAPAACSSSKLGWPMVARRPSQMVSGTRSVTRSPRANDAAVSAPLAGSAR